MMTDIFYQIPGYREERILVDNRDMLFTFDDVKDNLSKYLSNWIGKSDSLWPVYVLFSKPYYQKDLDTETEFMILAQALEAYYRHLTQSNKKIPLESILEYICNVVRDQYPSIVEQFLGVVDEFCKRVALGRHNLAHHPTPGIPKAVGWRERPLYIKRMQFLLRLCLVIELELPPEKIRPRIYQNNDFNFLTSNW